MGRFLEIVRATEHAALLSLLPPRPVPIPTPIIRPVVDKEPPFDQAVSDVLGILVRADQPVSHPKIVGALMGRGYTKTEAYQAIARCQKRHWIEHDLETGYVLAS